MKMDIISQFENEDKYYLKKLEEIINSGPVVDDSNDFHFNDLSNVCKAIIDFLELYLLPCMLGLVYLRLTKYITNNDFLNFSCREEFDQIDQDIKFNKELDMEIVFNHLYNLPESCQKIIINEEDVNELIKIQIIESIKRNQYSSFYNIIVDNKLDVSELFLPIQDLIFLEKFVHFLGNYRKIKNPNAISNYADRLGFSFYENKSNMPINMLTLTQMMYLIYILLNEIFESKIYSEPELKLITDKLSHKFSQIMCFKIQKNLHILKYIEEFNKFDGRDVDIIYSYLFCDNLNEDIIEKGKLLTNEINESNILIQSFYLPNNYFELPPEKDESLYLGAKDNAIITTEGVRSFSKLINFIVDNNYVKTGEEHNTSTDLKFDLAFKLTGKMRPSILCPKIIWTNSDYTNPLVAIAKGLGGNYDKLKDLFIIDSSFHNRLASIYAERLHTDDKFTNFFYELYPKMKKVNKPTKNNAAN